MPPAKKKKKKKKKSKEKNVPGKRKRKLHKVKDQLTCDADSSGVSGKMSRN